MLFLFLLELSFMKLIIYWNNNDSEELYDLVINSLDELGLIDFIEIEKNNNDELKTKLEFTKIPALIVEEESIDFVDVISEWIVPTKDDMKGILISIIWWTWQDCSSSWDCWVSCFC